MPRPRSRPLVRARRRSSTRPEHREKRRPPRNPPPGTRRPAAGLALHEAPDYAELHDGLERRARELLGPDADVTPDPRGGVIATAPGRLVDLSLAAIAARTVDALGEEVARLWTR
jgi:hypothetical protein